MTETEHLLTVLIEECAEIQYAAAKALRFGLDDTFRGEDAMTPRQEIQFELDDLEGVAQLMGEAGIIGNKSQANANAKKMKVREMLAYSESQGRLRLSEVGLTEQQSNGNGQWTLPDGSQGPTWNTMPRFASDIACAFQVVEKMRERGLQLFELQQLRGDWTAIFSTDGLNGRMKACESAETPARAICLAAFASTTPEE